ncbi:DUF3179 domain-containing protein [Patescibacteria group bacterium]|nr:DUF3179 domain-containing protein [Patescibacteria group bacterium]
MQRAQWFGPVVIIALLVGRDDFSRPRGGETKTTTVQVVRGDDEIMTEKEVMVTDGVKHTVSLNEIRQGCPGRDCIPSIDNPIFETVPQAASWLGDDEIGLSLTIGKIDKFYPYRILVSHELVNDTFESAVNGQEKSRVLVSYCPLCFTGIVFDPLVGGERVEFGVSGKLWNSNLIMYDRKTETLWSQITGEAIVGELAGSELSVIPSDVTKFGLWRAQHQAGQVLSRKTGRLSSSYDRIPYGGDLTNIPPIFPVSNTDARLGDNDYILGIVIDGKAKAYLFEAVKKAGQVEDTVAGQKLLVEYLAENEAVRISAINADGSKERLGALPSFWFSWVAVHPKTDLYK